MNSFAALWLPAVVTVYEFDWNIYFTTLHYLLKGTRKLWDYKTTAEQHLRDIEKEPRCAKMLKKRDRIPRKEQEILHTNHAPAVNLLNTKNSNTERESLILLI